MAASASTQPFGFLVSYPFSSSSALSWRRSDPRFLRRGLMRCGLKGLINNILYVIILSGALDLVGPSVPKGVVLLADVAPSFAAKLFVPYFIHKVPYAVRILFFVCTAAFSMVLIALTPAATDGASVALKMVGVMLASLVSGCGELSFLGLTHFYGQASLAAWGSGTGGAGLLGAGAYAVATNVFKMSVRHTLLASAFLPVVMLVAFFAVLPRGPLRQVKHRYAHERSKPASSSHVHPQGASDEADGGPNDAEDEALLENSESSPTDRSNPSPSSSPFQKKLRLIPALFFPFMLPLLLVYIAEYTINQGILPDILFPLPSSPFDHFRAFYPAYNAIYQAGVFISRSSTPFFRIHSLYTPSFLQVVNLFILGLHAVYDFLPNFYVVCIIVFWEGLLGGLVYVSTFAEILDTVPEQEREFSLSATSVSDSAGICIAGLLGMALEVALCEYQVRRGRDYCTKL